MSNLRSREWGIDEEHYARCTGNTKRIPDNYRKCLICGRPISSNEYYMYNCSCKDCWRCRHNG